MVIISWVNILKNKVQQNKGKILKWWFSVFIMLFCADAFADNCLVYKKIPQVYINTPDWEKQIIQPNTPMDLWHGNVIATMIDKYDIVADIEDIKDGFCVSLKTVNAVVGYNNFRVHIDINHIPDTCSYNAVLAHEEQHIQTYLSVINDFKSEFQKSVFLAADSVMPIYVNSRDDINKAIDMMNKELQSHPDLILIKQKIKAAEEIRNKKIDQNYNKDELKKCFE